MRGEGKCRLFHLKINLVILSLKMNLIVKINECSTQTVEVASILLPPGTYALV